MFSSEASITLVTTMKKSSWYQVSRRYDPLSSQSPIEIALRRLSSANKIVKKISMRSEIITYVYEQRKPYLSIIFGKVQQVCVVDEFEAAEDDHH